MATKREIREDMRAVYGSFLTLSQTASYMGVDSRVAKSFVTKHKLAPVMIGTRWKYSVVDLARCLATER